MSAQQRETTKIKTNICNYNCKETSYASKMRNRHDRNK